jgi:hypothetical protein
MNLRCGYIQFLGVFKWTFYPPNIWNPTLKTNKIIGECGSHLERVGNHYHCRQPNPPKNKIKKKTNSDMKLKTWLPNAQTFCPQVNKLKTLLHGTLDRKERALIEWICWPMRFYSFANDSILSHLLLKKQTLIWLLFRIEIHCFFVYLFFLKTICEQTNHHAFTSFRLLPSSPTCKNYPKYNFFTFFWTNMWKQSQPDSFNTTTKCYLCSPLRLL